MEALYGDQERGAGNGALFPAHARAVGSCLGLPEAGNLVGAAVMSGRVGEGLASWLGTGEWQE